VVGGREVNIGGGSVAGAVELRAAGGALLGGLLPSAVVFAGEDGEQLEGRPQLHVEFGGEVRLREERQAAPVDALLAEHLRVLRTQLDAVNELKNFFYTPGGDVILVRKGGMGGRAV